MVYFFLQNTYFLIKIHNYFLNITYNFDKTEFILVLLNFVTQFQNITSTAIDS